MNHHVNCLEAAVSLDPQVFDAILVPGAGQGAVSGYPLFAYFPLQWGFPKSRGYPKRYGL